MVARCSCGVCVTGFEGWAYAACLGGWEGWSLDCELVCMVKM